MFHHLNMNYIKNNNNNINVTNFHGNNVFKIIFTVCTLLEIVIKFYI